MSAPLEVTGGAVEAQPESVLEGTGAAIEARSLGQIAWMRLKRDRVAMTSGVIVLLLILWAVVAPLLQSPAGVYLRPMVARFSGALTGLITRKRDVSVLR